MERFFTGKGIPYVCRDIRRDRAAFREWRERYGGDIVPMVVLDGGKKVIDGCDIPAIERAMADILSPAP